MRNPTRFVAFLTVMAAVAFPAHAEYPASKTAGFHHCALIYNSNSRMPKDLAPYVAYDKQPAWLFDAFLFLIQSSGRGRGTEYGETQKVDWEYQLDRWFAAGRDLAALDDAIDTASTRLGPPPSKRRVMLSIPYVNRAVRDFGNINGTPADLSTAVGRDAAVNWYVAEAIRRFEAARYRHLELWGFYWMREDIGEEDVPLVKAAADIVHATGHRLLWIPCNGDTGYPRWKRAGVDVAIYQPNYAFGTWQNGGRIGRNRIAATARAARSNGLGVEIEAFEIETKPADRRVFAQYLADGAPRRFGYQAAPTAYYLGTDMVERTSRSRNPGARQSYDSLARYVRNQPVSNPDPPIRWHWASRNGTRVAEARFTTPRPIAALETFLDEPVGKDWRGVVQVDVLRSGAKHWTPGGWAIRSGKASDDGVEQWFIAPVGGTIVGIRASFKPRPGSGPLRVTSLAIDPNDIPNIRAHKGLARPYTVSPQPTVKYGDTGRLLTDGVTAGGFLTGHTVGWMALGKSAAICFDLGRVMPVSEVQAFVQGGGVGAVYWPASTIALFAVNSAPPTSPEGRGALPAILASVPGGKVVVDGQRAGNDMDGHVPFRPARPVRARYVTLLMSSRQWLMLSEVRIFVNGRNVAPKAHYVLCPLPGGPSEDPNAAYADDGARLTNGVVADGFVAEELTGWQNERVHTVIVDIGARQPIREVVAWSLQGGEHDIYAPREVIMDVSSDGASWRPYGTVHPVEREDGRTCSPLACRIRVPKALQARFVRLRVTHSRGWAMLSEVEVR